MAENNPPPETVKKKILIVDDEAMFTRMVRMNLEQTGLYEVKEENRASHALVAAREFRPDLVLLDVIMPGMDGGDLANQFKHDFVLRKTPIVFLTATVSKSEAKEGGHKAGGYLFLAKPVSLKVLLKTVEDYLSSPDQGA